MEPSNIIPPKTKNMFAQYKLYTLIPLHFAKIVKKRYSSKSNRLFNELLYLTSRE